MKYQPYIDEVEKMEKAEQFAEKLHLFKDVILSCKMTWYSEYTKFWERYKDIYLSWGINRSHFISWTNVTIGNCKKEYDIYLYNIYVNSVSLYDAHEKYWLEELANIDWVYHYDSLNSKFYITDEWIEWFLEALNEWYLKARELASEKSKTDKIRNLQEEMDRLTSKI